MIVADIMDPTGLCHLECENELMDCSFLRFYALHDHVLSRCVFNREGLGPYQNEPFISGGRRDMKNRIKGYSVLHPSAWLYNLSFTGRMVYGSIKYHPVTPDKTKATDM